MNAIHDPDDATLVAWLDGELDAAAAADVARTAAADAALAGRVQLLRAARAELALHAPLVPPHATRAWPRLVALSIAVAAALVVVVLARTTGPRDDAGAANELLEVRIVPLRPAWDLFSGIRFELEGTAMSDTPVRVVARHRDETDAQLTERVAADESLRRTAPVVLDAEVTDGAGRTRSGPVVRVEGAFTSKPSRLTVELVDVVLPHDGINPYVAAELGADRARENFFWGFERAGVPAAGGAHGWVPEEPGEYRIIFSLRSFTAATDTRWPRFEAPLSVATAFAIRGVVGAWSAPVDGMCARIVAPPRPPAAGAPLPLAVQLRNDSDRPRKYNVNGLGSTQAPWPFHFDLRVDGLAWRQRTELAVIHSGTSLFLPQPPGTVRSVIVIADYWTHGEERPSSLAGVHTLAAHFEFQATLWNSDDKQIWNGTLEAPPIEIDFGAPR